MAQHTSSEADTARAIGVSTKTLQRYRKPDAEKGRPAIPHTKNGSMNFYDIEEARAFHARWGGTKFGATPSAPVPAAPPGSTPPPDGGATAAGARGRVAESQVRAGLLMQKAKAAGDEAKIRAGYENLGLGEQIAAARTLEALADVDRTLATLVAKGKVLPGDARALGERITSQRQLLRAMERKAPPADFTAALIATLETMPLLEAFEGITDPDRRARALAFVLAVAEEDRAAGPKADTGEPGPSPSAGAA